ncbi:MAG TPA: hypothetical protein VGL91_19745 [Acidobacteriota bacterium]|jgi:prophage maintenance system killer protein
MDFVYLTADQIITIHDYQIATFGGLNGIRSHQAFLSAVYQAQQSAFGEDAYSTIPEKAAAS